VFSQSLAQSFYLLADLEVESPGWRPLLGSLSLSSLDLLTPSLSCLQQLLAGDLVSDRLLELGDLPDLEDLLDGLEDLLLELLLCLDVGLLAALPLGELAGACEGVTGQGVVLAMSGLA
jgi:hypothetical protein